jgi:hypothetical protein
MRIVSLLAIAALALAPAVYAATAWRVVKTGSSTGDFAIKSITADVQHPGAIGVRFVGSVASGTAIVSCSKGSAIGAWSRTYTRAGTFTLPMTRGAEMCSVVAAVGGSGRVIVQILRR